MFERFLVWYIIEYNNCLWLVIDKGFYSLNIEIWIVEYYFEVDMIIFINYFYWALLDICWMVINGSGLWCWMFFS